jgi:hypothetical protein
MNGHHRVVQLVEGSYKDPKPVDHPGDGGRETEIRVGEKQGTGGERWCRWR